METVTRITCNQCKECRVEDTTVLDCSYRDCSCHTKTMEEITIK